MKAKPLPPREALSRAFHYTPETGALQWKTPTNRKIRAGTEAGTTNNKGYRIVSFQGQLYLASRLIWVLMTGAEPLTVDHVNRVRTDNRWCNLREANYSEQNYNTSRACTTESMFSAVKTGNGRMSVTPQLAGTHPHNTSGRKGVYWDKLRKCWIAKIGVNRKMTYLGGYATFSEAVVVREKAEQIHFGRVFVNTRGKE